VAIVIRSGLSAQILMTDRQNSGLDISNARATLGDLNNVFAIRRRLNNVVS